MEIIERERVFLLKRLPEDILKYKSTLIKIGDFTVSNNIDILKIRQKGEEYELIKKEFIKDGTRMEHIIPLNKQEFDLLYPVAPRKHDKIRYFYPLGKYVCEIDIYQGGMSEYARAEIEFASEEEMKSFVPPDWLGAEITSLNHSIHENLGNITFQTMVKRYKDYNISLDAIYINA